MVRLESRARWRGRALVVTAGALLALGAAAACGGIDVNRQLASCRAKLVESRQVHSALARTEGDTKPVAATPRRPRPPVGT